MDTHLRSGACDLGELVLAACWIAAYSNTSTASSYDLSAGQNPREEQDPNPEFGCGKRWRPLLPRVLVALERAIAHRCGPWCGERSGSWASRSPDGAGLHTST